MIPVKDAWLARQHARWLRPNAHLYVRPDAGRYVRPESDLSSFLSLLEDKADFNPSQPRVPSGNSGGGQWAAGGSADQTNSNVDEVDDVHVDADVDSNSDLSAIRRRIPQQDCELLYKRDLFQCRMVGSPACYQQALARYYACQKGLPLPPLSY